MAIKYLCDLCGKDASNEVTVTIRKGVTGDKPVIEEKVRHACDKCTDKVLETWKIKK